MFELKPLSKDAIPAALDKAMRYRLLNEPLEAESICHDVLRIDPDNQQALVLLLLALSDQFGKNCGPTVAQAKEVLAQLREPYERAYYAGIIAERRAKAQLELGAPNSGFAAYDWLSEAMAWYEKAESLRPPGNDDALLRWNACARLMMQNNLTPRPEEQFEPSFE